MVRPNAAYFPKGFKISRNGVSKFLCRNRIGFFFVNSRDHQNSQPNCPFSAQLLAIASILARHTTSITQPIFTRRHSRNDSDVISSYFSFGIFFLSIEIQVKYNSGHPYTASAGSALFSLISPNMAALLYTYLETVTWALALAFHSDVLYLQDKIVFRGLNSVSLESQGSKRCSTQPHLPQFT